MIILPYLLILASICCIEAAPHHASQVLLVPQNQIPDSSVFHRRSVLLYSNPTNNFVGSHLFPQNNLVYYRQDGQTIPQPSYFNTFYNYIPSAVSSESPSIPSDFPLRGAFPEQPEAEEPKVEKIDPEVTTINSAGKSDKKPTKLVSAKLELEPEAELIPDEVKIGSKPSNDAPPRPPPGAPGIPGYPGVPGVYPGAPGVPGVPGVGVPQYTPGLLPYPSTPGVIPGQTPQVYFLNGSPHIFGTQPTYRYPGLDHRFFIYQQPTALAGQYPGGQPVIYLSGLRDSSSTGDNYQKLQIPGEISEPSIIGDQAEYLEQPKDVFAQFAQQQSKDMEIQRDAIVKMQEKMDAQTYQRLQNQKTYVDELHQPIKVETKTNENPENPEKPQLSRVLPERKKTPESSDETLVNNVEIKKVDVIEDDSVTIEAKPQEELNHPDLKVNPSVAESKPQAIAIAGLGGIAQAAPGSTSLSGKSGLSVSSPVATALAGALPQRKKLIKN